MRKERATEQALKTEPALLICMMGMVLVNLLFVQLTKAADTLWLMPLYALTLAAPVLARFKEQLWYRGLWNAVMIAFLGLLAQHAMSKNLEYVLQDGLILAVLSQVHLLNNLRAEQRPDLLFLNSFLIAIITGYITVDLAFAAAFLVYAPFFIIGLQYLSVVQAGFPLPEADARTVLLDGIRRSSVLLGLALFVFLFWPRNFQREPLFAEYFEFDSPTDASEERSEVGFSEGLQLKKRDHTDASEVAVLMVGVKTGEQSDIPELWRGATLPVHGSNDNWKTLGRIMRPSEFGANKRWRRRRTGLSRLRYAEPKGSVQLQVKRLDASTPRLFLPDSAETVSLDPRHTQARLQPDGDGTMQYPNPGQLHYEVTLKSVLEKSNSNSSKTASMGGLSDAETSDDADTPPSIFTRLAPSSTTASAIALAQRLRRQLPADADQARIVDHFANYLRGEFSYRFPGEGNAAESLNQFLTSNAGGHCEFFASALTTMLRSIDIPSRVVTGFRSNRWDELTQTRTFYNLDAHAWVEVLDQKGNWRSVDPTPAADPLMRDQGLWANLQDSVYSLWNQVTGFDAESRTAAMAWIKAAPGRALRAMASAPIRTASVLGGCALLLFAIRIRRKRKTPRSVRVLHATFKKAGLELVSDKTPREVLRTLHTKNLSKDQRKALRRAVEEHERDRYAA